MVDRSIYYPLYRVDQASFRPSVPLLLSNSVYTALQATGDRLSS